MAEPSMAWHGMAWHCIAVKPVSFSIFKSKTLQMHTSNSSNGSNKLIAHQFVFVQASVSVLCTLSFLYEHTERSTNTHLNTNMSNICTCVGCVLRIMTVVCVRCCYCCFHFCFCYCIESRTCGVLCFHHMVSSDHITINFHCRN